MGWYVVLTRQQRNDMQQIIHTNNIDLNQIFGVGEFSSIIYHDMFDYPLTFRDMIRWRTGSRVKPLMQEAVVVQSAGFYHLEGERPLVLKRIMRSRISSKKTVIAKKAAKILSLIPSIKMVGLTGALAMGNACEDSDIDLLIITSRGTLWSTRAVVYALLKTLRMIIRKPGDKNQKDKLCLNIWMDEADLEWDKRSRNIFTAHEIAQIEPLYYSGGIYETLMNSNRWVSKYWPNAVQKKYFENKMNNNLYQRVLVIPLRIFEPITKQVQMLYMKKKVTRETITPTKALFHPIDWSSIVIDRLQNKLLLS